MSFGGFSVRCGRRFVGVLGLRVTFVVLAGVMLRSGHGVVGCGFGVMLGCVQMCLLCHD